MKRYRSIDAQAMRKMLSWMSEKFTTIQAEHRVSEKIVPSCRKKSVKESSTLFNRPLTSNMRP